MAPRPCLTPGCPNTTLYSRCKACKGRQTPKQAQQLGRAHKKIRDRVIARHVASRGWTCPGFKRPEHPVPPGYLTADHKVPRTVRPDLYLVESNYAVLCAPCNSRKGNRAVTREPLQPTPDDLRYEEERRLRDREAER